MLRKKMRSQAVAAGHSNLQARVHSPPPWLRWKRPRPGLARRNSAEPELLPPRLHRHLCVAPADLANLKDRLLQKTPSDLAERRPA